MLRLSSRHLRSSPLSRLHSLGNRDSVSGMNEGGENVGDNNADISIIMSYILQSNAVGIRLLGKGEES